MSITKLFPLGMLKRYQAPKSYIDDINLDDFKYTQYEKGDKQRTPKFDNILMLPELTELKKFVMDSAKDFLDTVLEMKYEEFFITESWINISTKGDNQRLHNHSNSILSGVHYLKTEENHPPLIFKKQSQQTEPFMSIREHHKKNYDTMSFPCTQDTMVVFNSYMYHMHFKNKIDTDRISLSWNGLVNFATNSDNLNTLSFDRTAYTRPCVFIKKET